MDKHVEMTVMVYVDGELVDEHTNSSVPYWAVNYVAAAAVVQVEDPDLKAARDAEDESWPDSDSAVRGR